MSKLFNRVVEILGREYVVSPGGTRVRVLRTSTIDDGTQNKYVIEAQGNTVPADAETGYAKGCLFRKLNGGISTSLYVNVGSVTSANFDILIVEAAPVAVTGSSVTITQAAHGNKAIVLDRAAGIAVTLPAASGTGTKYTFVTKTTVTSNTTTIKVANSSDTMTGTALTAQDAGDTSVMFETAADTDTITGNGTTTGGIKGDIVELIDVATNLWSVRVTQSATGIEATPFSATV